LNESCLPKVTELWIFNTKQAALLYGPLDKAGCQVIQLVRFGDLNTINEEQNNWAIHLDACQT